LCRACGKSFSETVASLDFRMQKRGIFAPVFQQFCEGLCNRQIARLLKVDERTVRIRLRRLAQQSLLQHTNRIRSETIAEPICFDGLENFAASQYEPNNVNQAIGRDSLFIYDFGFCPLNRKGRMSDRQKLNKAKLEASLGRFCRHAIRSSSTEVFGRLLDKRSSGAVLTLLSDQHFQYPRAIRKLGAEAKHIEHVTISSKAPRVYRHILFPVNHADLLVRQHVKAFQRETISFSKSHGYMAQKFALFLAWKNYFRPQFTKKQKLNPASNVRTPAMALGLCPKALAFKDYFRGRYCKTQITLPAEWELFFEGRVRDFRQPLNREERNPHFLPHN